MDRESLLYKDCDRSSGILGGASARDQRLLDLYLFAPSFLLSAFGILLFSIDVPSITVLPSTTPTLI